MINQLTEDWRVEIADVLKTKNPQLYKKLPSFLVSYLRKLIHQDELNAFLEKHHDLDGVDFLNTALSEFFDLRKKIYGQENLVDPQGKRYVFVSNHPLGGLDGLFFISVISEIAGETKAIINDVLLFIKNLRSLFIGVNLYGSNSRESVKVLEDAFSADYHMLLFPAGLVSRPQKGVIQDFEWKNTFIKKAIKHNRDIVPIHISGELSSFFYRLYKLRKFVGIKTNFELIYLADEMFKQYQKTLTMHIGEPVPVDYLDKSRSHTEWAQLMRSYVYHLGEGGKTSFQDFSKNTKSI